MAKGKIVPLAHLADVLAPGAGFSGPSIWGTGLARTGPRSEYHARGDVATARALPWMPGHARIVGDGFVASEPFDACPRRVLRRASARLTQRGWHLRLGIEPEFFLLRHDGQRWRPPGLLRRGWTASSAGWTQAPPARRTCSTCPWPRSGGAASACCRSRWTRR